MIINLKEGKKMRHKHLKLIALLLLGFGSNGLLAQTMFVRESNGTQTAYGLSNIRKTTFSGGNVSIQKIDNTTSVFDLSGLRYLNFTDLTVSIVEQPVQPCNSRMITYPNPVTDVLNIDLTGEEDAGTLSLLTIEGKVMQRQFTRGNSLVSLNLIQLPKGIYLCQYQNERSIKSVKIIKQ
jgi:hypothetical protein